ncbi:MAG: hypothetical protein ACLFMX_03795 [Halobacteriales archaeon]
MSLSERPQDIDRSFLWRTAAITLVWLVIFVGTAVLLWTFQDAIHRLFF